MATKLDELDAKKRRLSLQKSVKDLKAALDNTDRLKRLLAISDSEWNEAEQKDARGSDNAA
jgi:hypothetical protein